MLNVWIVQHSDAVMRSNSKQDQSRRASYVARLHGPNHDLTIPIRQSNTVLAHAKMNYGLRSGVVSKGSLLCRCFSWTIFWGWTVLTMWESKQSNSCHYVYSVISDRFYTNLNGPSECSAFMMGCIFLQAKLIKPCNLAYEMKELISGSMGALNWSHSGSHELMIL
jgi:hypothetical protein